MNISIVIATYNSEKFISRVIEDILVQSFLPVEIVIVNDASTDDTLNVLNALASKNELIHVVDLNCNSGPGKARNEGINVAKGDWVAIVDSDDRLEPDYLESIVMAASNQAADIYATNFFLFDPNQNRKIAAGLNISSASRLVSVRDFLKGARPFSDEADFGLLKPVFKKRFLKDNSVKYPINIRHGEDFEILFMALLKGASFLFINKPVYLYSVRTSGLSKTRVNYPRMAEATLELINHPLVKLDGNLQALLKTRADGVYKLDSQLFYNDCKSNEQILKILLRSIRDANCRRMLACDIVDFLERIPRKIRSILTRI